MKREILLFVIPAGIILAIIFSAFIFIVVLSYQQKSSETLIADYYKLLFKKNLSDPQIKAFISLYPLIEKYSNETENQIFQKPEVVKILEANNISPKEFLTSAEQIKISMLILEYLDNRENLKKKLEDMKTLLESRKKEMSSDAYNYFKKEIKKVEEDMLLYETVMEIIPTETLEKVRKYRPALEKILWKGEVK